MDWELLRVSRRWRGRVPLTGGVVATSLAIAACGSSAPSPTILDTAKVERAIEQASLTQRGAHVQVSCPAGVRQESGLVFSCTAVAGKDRTKFVVTEMDGAGHVHYEAR